VQGVFGAILTPVVLALLSTIFTDPRERDKAFGIYGAIAGGGAGLGLLLGGFLTSYASWRWTLFVNIIFAILATVGTLLWLKDDRSSDRDPLDITGLIVITLGLFGIVFGLSHANTTSWTNGFTIAYLAGGVLFSGLFVWIEKTAKYPLLPLRVLADRTRGASSITSLFASIGIFGVFLFLTYYLQGILGWSAIKTGVAYLPMIGGLVAMSVFTNNWILPKFGPRLVVPFGMIVSSIALFFLHSLGLHTPYLTHIMPTLILLGLGFGLSLAPSFNTGTLGLAEHDAGVGSAVLNTAQQVGGSIGTALLNTIAASAATAYLVGKVVTPTTKVLSVIHSYSVAFLWSAAIFLVGAALAAILFRSGNLATITKAARE
jgi:predicted MFS family arabinose efflux permease